MRKLWAILRRMFYRPKVTFVRGLATGPVAFPKEFAKSVAEIYRRKEVNREQETTKVQMRRR